MFVWKKNNKDVFMRVGLTFLLLAGHTDTMQQ